jgi:murein L,D-transpeptidase YafK
MKRLLAFLFVVITFFSITSFKSKKAGADDYYIIIEKHKYELTVYDADDNALIIYPVVFGSKDLGDKMMQGDRKTPEGIFHIISKRPHPKWNKFLAIDYPNEASIEKFNERKANGQIPYNAQIGGDIGIHGTWPHEDFAVDQYQNWTQGCVSTKNIYVNQLFNTMAVGTTVIIKR